MLRQMVDLFVLQETIESSGLDCWSELLTMVIDLRHAIDPCDILRARKDGSHHSIAAGHVDLDSTVTKLRRTLVRSTTRELRHKHARLLTALDFDVSIQRLATLTLHENVHSEESRSWRLRAELRLRAQESHNLATTSAVRDVRDLNDTSCAWAGNGAGFDERDVRHEFLERGSVAMSELREPLWKPHVLGVDECHCIA